MANDVAAIHQLPIMVRKPKAVWPGLAKMGMYQKQIAGDGNCLFASLSDQLHGTPVKHAEIRANVIEHMRNYRPLFEHYVHKDDVQQRRALRSTTTHTKLEMEDAFEDYLSLMSRIGTYGGEPELVAFCQVYDQDVTVHLPQIRNFDRDSIHYSNEHRISGVTPNSLHICYGGDEITRAHYNSARSRDSSQARAAPIEIKDSARSFNGGTLSASPSNNLSARAIRNSRSDLSSELIYDLLQKGRRDVDGTLDMLNDKYRPRSPSIASSRRSSSSKRSLEDDADSNPRAIKRMGLRRSARRRPEIILLHADYHSGATDQLHTDLSVTSTSNSTQEIDSPEPSQEHGHGEDTDEPSSVAGGSSDSEGVEEIFSDDHISPPSFHMDGESLSVTRTILPTRTRESVIMSDRPRSTVQT